MSNKKPYKKPISTEHQKLKADAERNVEEMRNALNEIEEKRELFRQNKSWTENAHKTPQVVLNVPLGCFTDTPEPQWYNVQSFNVVALCFERKDEQWVSPPVLLIIADFHNPNPDARRFIRYLSTERFPKCTKESRYTFTDSESVFRA